MPIFSVLLIYENLHANELVVSELMTTMFRVLSIYLNIPPVNFSDIIIIIIIIIIIVAVVKEIMASNRSEEGILESKERQRTRVNLSTLEAFATYNLLLTSILMTSLILQSCK